MPETAWLDYKGTENLNNQKALKFELEFSKEIREYLEPYVQDQFFDANPSYLMELLSVTAAYSLTLSYDNELDNPVALQPIPVPVREFSDRSRDSYEFYLTAFGDLFSKKTAEEVYTDFGEEIETLMNELNPKQLARHSDAIDGEFQKVLNEARRSGLPYDDL